MLCDRCPEPLTFGESVECVEVGEVHHLDCIARCPHCQDAYIEDANTDAARGK